MEIDTGDANIFVGRRPEQHLINLAQMLDTLKSQDWKDCWSAWDQQQRDWLTQQINAASPASRDGRQGELAQAIAERNELRKDAARYWFLRSVPEPKVREVVGWLQWLSKEAFDAAIDEAIATAQKEQTYAPAATAEGDTHNPS